MTCRAAVSVVIPVHNGRRFLPAVLEAVSAECAGRPDEIIVVDDGSTDGSVEYLHEQEAAGRIRLLSGSHRGYAAAINAGIREARCEYICQVDQDVIVQPGWLCALLEALTDRNVAAAQGCYVTATDASFWARMMGRDLELRYARIGGSFVDHVCTGNTVYRADALHSVGLLDESLGYGADNDLSYRLADSGHLLAFCRDARSVHRWRDDLVGYLRQQFGMGYGRLDLIARHPRRAGGDAVSGTLMMLHAPVMLAVLILLLAAVGQASGLAPEAPFAKAAAGLAGLVVVERLVAGIAAWRCTGDPAPLAFPAVHLLRDLAWAAAITLWAARRAAGAGRSPQHSMPRRARAFTRRPVRLQDRDSSCRLLAVVPAFNEAANLESVVRDIRGILPDLDILIVDDGSTDETTALLPRLGVSWLTLPDRLGVGGAVRAGLKYAVRRGYDRVVRIDGDGQHRARDIARLLSPVLGDEADAAVGSRYLGRGAHSGRSLGKACLSLLLTLLARERITDATSGYWLFGPRALRLLARHHPTGYPEPELRLLLHRHGLRVTEIPVRTLPRRAGKTSLTWSRTGTALARTLLALVIVPTRRVEQEEGASGD
ncbi:MAG TPA: glycosyltransferase [Vicinamibacterales bacterium]|nr:glycosyltransferase [Vicinamibacterales bacterium]